MYKSLPQSASDVLQHVKDTDKTEKVVFPISRYSALLSAPNVVKDSDQILGAPFHLLETETEELSMTQIRRLCGFIV